MINVNIMRNVVCVLEMVVILDEDTYTRFFWVLLNNRSNKKKIGKTQIAEMLIFNNDAQQI